MERTDAETAKAGEETVARITGVLAGFVTDEGVEIVRSTRLFDDLGLDSTNVLEMLVELEAEMDIEFDTDTLEFSHFETVDSLAAFVSGMMKA
ncbi:acyl carrier protein [Nocardiopsis sp. CNT312]|uniref:acyl carrier protein n=1 Tax=Nocardiopsis sp. CNT312 TaxID=1137268 RepID=UPI0004902479|nr:acyl carrier protein [Nocardiopsis sp. CNT312]